MIEEKNKSSWRLYSSTNDNGQRKNVQKINRRSERPQIENSTVTRMQLAISYISELWMASFLYIANRVFFFSSLKVLTISMTIFVQSLFLLLFITFLLSLLNPIINLPVTVTVPHIRRKVKIIWIETIQIWEKSNCKCLTHTVSSQVNIVIAFQWTRTFFSVLKFHVERERNVKLCECGQFWSRTLV